MRVFKWSGKNDYVALCEPEYISFGGGYVYLWTQNPHSADEALVVTVITDFILTIRLVTAPLRAVPRLTTSPCVRLVHNKAKMLRLNA